MNDQRLSSTWTKGVEEGLMDEVRSEYAASPLLRRRVREMMDEKSESALKEGVSKEGYETPNWAYKQADLCGYLRALEEIKNLFSK